MAVLRAGIVEPRLRLTYRQSTTITIESSTVTIVQNTTEKRGAIPPPPEDLTRREDLSFTSVESAQPLSGRLLLYNSYLIYLALSFQSILLDADKIDFFTCLIF